jgi:hypothetical protein
LKDANDATVLHKGDVTGSLIDGEWAVEPRH